MRWPQLPDYGCIPRWPHDSDDVFHPNDVSAARHCFRTQCVFRRDSFDGVYYRCVYGELQFRMKPCLWFPVRPDGIDIGDWVETKGVGMSREIFVGTVESMQFAAHENCIHYKLKRGEMTYHANFSASELRLLDQKVKLEPRNEFRLEPQAGEAVYQMREES